MALAVASGGDLAEVTQIRVSGHDSMRYLHGEVARVEWNSIAGSARCGGGQTRVGNGEGWLGGVALLR